MVDSIEVIAEKIIKLQVQGARNVAIAAVQALQTLAKQTQAATKPEFLVELKKAQTLLYSTRPTEPLMRNALRYIITQTQNEPAQDIGTLRGVVSQSASIFLRDLSASRERAAEIGAKRIGEGSVVFTHCHSSTVTRLLAKAKEDGVDFRVVCTETRPAYQGRITAKELVGLGIDTTFIVDSAARTFMSDVDVVFVGADAITSEGNVVNKIGTGGIAVIASEARAPFYVVSELLKFDAETLGGGCEEIEQRSPSEVWAEAPPQLKVKNPAFDVTPNRYIHGLICEEGIIPPQGVLETVRKRYPWVF
ncbi:MAG: S-methyl-5-thioribose-1-phosphate isomerase [Candidatus Bathyarchaeota archaeon]|nr:S-methyl-5-thioribose-1-phosphate isomerase [Candidatus Bathyarchaeota archaeon]